MTDTTHPVPRARAHRRIFRALITDRFDIQAHARLRGHANLEIKTSERPEPAPGELAEADALLIRSRTKITDELLARAPNLKVIITSTSGFDHIDLAATSQRSVQVMYTPEANAASACELTWGLVLACLRRIPEAHKAVKSGDWKREALLGRQLAGQIYGVVGIGRIGTRVSRVARAFGMKVIGFDPYQEDDHFGREGIERVSLEELLKMSDVISFHVPATAETHRMISLANLEYINRGACIVNTSRGSVIAESDLATALQSGWISACGLDVFEREPLPRHSALLSLPNVVLSPHLGATTREAFAAASSEAADKLLRFIEAGEVTDPLPPPHAWYRMGFSQPGPADRS